MTRRTNETKSTPRMLPTTINAVDFQYASFGAKEGQAPEIKNAGSVKMAPAATDSPMEPAVRAMFSSSTDPLNTRKTAIPTTAAG